MLVDRGPNLRRCGELFEEIEAKHQILGHGSKLRPIEGYGGRHQPFLLGFPARRGISVGGGGRPGASRSGGDAPPFGMDIPDGPAWVIFSKGRAQR